MFPPDSSCYRLLRLTFAKRSLPTELRILIYKEVLYEDNGEEGVIKIKFRKRSQTTPFFQTFAIPQGAAHFLKLLQVNKKVNCEAAEILYAKTFQFKDPRTLQTFLIRVPAQTLCYIRRIGLENWQHPQQLDVMLTPTFALLRGAKKLEEFHFPIHILEGGLTDHRKLLPAEQGETLACTIGRSCAAVLYRYGYPMLVPWMEKSDNKGLEEAAEELGALVKMPDQAFERAASSKLTEGLKPATEDDEKTRKEKKRTREERLNEARETMLEVLVKLHRSPSFRTTLMKGYGGSQT